jgi:hypothetical protein
MIDRAIVFGLASLFAIALSAPGVEHISNVVAAAPQTGEAIGQVEQSGTKRALILCGLPGDKAHRKPFAETVEKLRETLIAKYGFAGPHVHVQFGGSIAEGEGPVLSGVRGQATREEIESEAADLRKVVKSEDTVWVIVMGHSYYDGKHSHFNIPGPDINEQEFGKLFADLPAREQVFFITIPTSGYYIKPLSAKGRVVISATEADLEVNETIYPMALAEVLASPPAAAEFDADRDGNLTLFDLYISVARNVVERYIKDEFLPTEHALLDDNGDGRGTELQIDYLTEAQGGRAKEGILPRPPRGTADGALSARIVLLRH